MHKTPFARSTFPSLFSFWRNVAYALVACARVHPNVRPAIHTWMPQHEMSSPVAVRQDAHARVRLHATFIRTANKSAQKGQNWSYIINLSNRTTGNTPTCKHTQISSPDPVNNFHSFISKLRLTTAGDPPHWPRDTLLSTKVGTKFRRQVVVAD
jgi:hypothetical protein